VHRARSRNIRLPEEEVVPRQFWEGGEPSCKCASFAAGVVLDEEDALGQREGGRSVLGFRICGVDQCPVARSWKREALIPCGKHS
jgi:hypothetical protein